MKLNNTVICNLSIVFVGNFNPSIISPSWLAHKKLIRDSEIENSDIKIIHPEISHFKLTFADIQVTKDKFIINCENEADFDLTKDLAVSIFLILKETPVSGIGINHTFYFSFNTIEEYNNFGNWLAPQNIWSDSLNNPKLLELKMFEPYKDESPVKSMVTVASSDRYAKYGVSFQINYHIETNRTKKKYPSDLIVDNWDQSSKKSNAVFNSIIQKFDG